MNTIIAVYHCIRKEDGKLYMRWLTEIAKDGIPEWIFKKVQMMQYPSIFRGIYRVLAK